MKDINVTLGERVRLVRNTNKLTREKLAEMIEVSPRFLAEVEAGKVGVSLQTLKNLSIALSVSTDYLLGLEGGNEFKLSAFYYQLDALDRKYMPVVYSIIRGLKNIDKEKADGAEPDGAQIDVPKLNAPNSDTAETDTQEKEDAFLSSFPQKE